MGGRIALNRIEAGSDASRAPPTTCTCYRVAIALRDVEAIGFRPSKDPLANVRVTHPYARSLSVGYLTSDLTGATSRKARWTAS